MAPLLSGMTDNCTTLGLKADAMASPSQISVFTNLGRMATTLGAFLRVTRGLFLLVGVPVMAQTSAPIHPAEPSVNLGQTSFLDALGGPGVLLEEIGGAYHSGKNMGSAGETIDATNSVSSLAHVALLSKFRVLKAFYGVELIGTAAHVNAGDGGTVGGWGDITVSPLILQWKEQTLGNVRVDQRFVLDFDLPIGEYDRSSSTSLSSHAFAVNPYYAVTLFPAKKIETSWRVHYLWNALNHAPPTASMTRSTQAGQAIHFNATTAFLCPGRLWVGANGYYLKQITAPQIGGVSLSDSPEQVASIGPGAVWKAGNFHLYANGYHEFAAENRPEGNRLIFRVEWTSGRQQY